MNLEDAKLWIVVHESDYGNTISTVMKKEMPTKEELIERLEIDFREDANEYIHVYEVETDNIVNMDVKQGQDVNVEPKIKIIVVDKFHPWQNPPEQTEELNNLSKAEHDVITELENYMTEKEGLDMEKNEFFVLLGYSADYIQFSMRKGDTQQLYYTKRVNLQPIDGMPRDAAGLSKTLKEKMYDDED